ncbi:MAG: Uma2 family endonuclease, partial [Deltaproteobacteria bacterium]
TYRLVATHAGEEVVQAVPFDAVPLDLASLWSR